MSLSYDLATALGIQPTKSVDYTSLGEVEFQRMVSLERRRASRSQKSSLLMLIDMAESISTGRRAPLQRILSAMQKVTRETDITGWYKENSIVGVMFTEITFDDHGSIPPVMMSRLHDTLKTQLSSHELRQININFHFLPEAKDDEPTAAEAYAPMYSEIAAPAAVTEASF